MEERIKKQEALHYLERALGVDDKWFSFRLSDDVNPRDLVLKRSDGL